MLEQAFTQVSEVSVRVSGGGDAFVHLDHMHAFPWHILTGEATEHLPRRVTAADCHNETSTLTMAARASAAIIVAAFCATASASISISTFMAVPTLRLDYWCDVFRTHSILQSFSCSSSGFPSLRAVHTLLVDFTRSPATRARTRRWVFPP